MGFNFVRKYIFLIGGLLFISAGILNLKFEKPVLELTKQDTALNINDNIYIFLNAGNKRLITDLLWIQTLIESDLDHYKQRDLNSWMFLRFKSISVLDPKFYENYLYGGQFLGIVKDDLEGADYIYEKGLRYYPDDYALNYNAGFTNYYEMGNFEKGLKYLNKIKNHPKTPVFLNSIITKLQLATGMSLDEIFGLVLFNYESTKDEALKNKLRKDLYAIKAEIDLICLNNNKPNCERKDLDGNDYILKGNNYYTAKPFLLYRINKRGETPSPQAFKEVNTTR